MAKLVSSNGEVLEVRDVGPVIFRLRRVTVPLKSNGHHVMEDKEARDLCRQYLDSGLFAGGKVEP